MIGVIFSGLASILALAYVIWNYGYRQGTTGSSIGKSVLKFKVVSEKTWQPIGFGMSIVRQIAHIVDGLVCYIGYLFPLWDAKRQTLGRQDHDHGVCAAESAAAATRGAAGPSAALTFFAPRRRRSAQSRGNTGTPTSQKAALVLSAEISVRIGLIPCSYLYGKRHDRTSADAR